MLKKNNQTIVIFEGPDRTGKTEISKAVGKVLNIPTFKRSLSLFNETHFFHSGDSSFRDATNYDQTYIVDFLRQVGSSVIFDRAYPSEFVYSKVFNRQRDVKTLELIDKEFAKLNTKIVLCVRESYGKYSDKNFEDKYFNDIHIGYLSFLKMTKCKFHVLWVDDENLNREVKEVIEFIGDK